MAVQDVLRDCNSMRFEGMITGEEAVAQEMEKLQNISTEELWNMHLKMGMISAKGRAIFQLLKEREPDSFRK